MLLWKNSSYLQNLHKNEREDKALDNQSVIHLQTDFHFSFLKVLLERKKPCKIKAEGGFWRIYKKQLSQ